jgi:hypothetical protein
MKTYLFVLVLPCMVSACAAPGAPRRTATGADYYEKIKSAMPASKLSLLPYCDVR